MVDSISANYAYYYQNGLYNNTGLSNATPCDSIYLNTPQQAQQDTYNPQFAGNQPKKKVGTVAKIIIGGLVLGGAFLIGKNWNTVSKWAKGLFKKGGKETVSASNQKAQKMIEKHANNVPVQKTNVKHKVKNTSVHADPKPITEAKKAKIMKNINLSHVDGNTRKMVEKASADIITPAQQKAYDKAIAYQAPTRKQDAAIKRMRKANAAQRAELNSLANNSKGAENLAKVEAGIKAEAAAAKKVSNGCVRHANGNIYHVENGAVTKVELYQNGVKNPVELTDSKKIAKHLAKHNVNMTDFVQPKSLNLVA